MATATDTSLGTEPDAEVAVPAQGQRVLAVALTFLLLVGAVALYVYAPTLITNYRHDVNFYESPAFMPRVALALVAIGASIHVVRILRGASLDAGEEVDDGTANRRVVAASIPFFAAYVLLVPLVGYWLSTVVFVLVAGGLAGIGWKKSVVIALLLGTACYLVFSLALKVWFPAAGLLGFFA
ncbi:tripartite tricarboxylate transporter TctB family protein [Variovorax sp. J31P179]|uniref:tripartite tricarboxylate transporter TctB family protein n=1 Tax=Variovorax sp. J31P179 TaxID=3053508 RepID=UPI002575224F|nr:tripartite tricarboxylate transporter TctB family protein [Variovorax sp. J31P179]MDM0084716.1 tripartite tricarboxylate transporter TctB family protein [Variovorax sp. J31P179]